MTLQEINDFRFEEGKLEMLLLLVSRNQLSKSVALETSGLTEAEFNQALEEYRKKAQ